MDTNVLCTAFRSRTGASFELFRRLRLGEWTAILSNHLLHEYEEKLLEQRFALGLSIADIERLLDAICARAEEWPLKPGWTPILSEPDDEPLVQLAVESGGMCIVTHNLRHLLPASSLGNEVLKPAEFLAKERAFHDAPS